MSELGLQAKPVELNEVLGRIKAPVIQLMTQLKPELMRHRREHDLVAKLGGIGRSPAPPAGAKLAECTAASPCALPAPVPRGVDEITQATYVPFLHGVCDVGLTLTVFVCFGGMLLSSMPPHTPHTHHTHHTQHTQHTQHDTTHTRRACCFWGGWP